ncbi:hypothetical protein [Pseudobacter ginsenosidimutans]|nr:hypothetical protein [Pseudobacter ginsenosidimutans]QEC44624.1 hypothetical protein FSB84_24175 [Pseudobacter ginsenosidimutans]
MKKIILFYTFLLIAFFAVAQKESYDMLSYLPPQGKGWKKENGNNFMSYSCINKKDWCQISVFKATVSKGSLDADFNSEWESLTAQKHLITAGPQLSETKAAGEWQVITGGAKASFNGADMMVLHTVMRNQNNCISIVAKTNSASFLQAIEHFTSSIDLIQSGSTHENNSPASHNNTNAITTTWDDGWISIMQENWAEVKKGNIRVLVHYPNKNADSYNSVLKDGLQNAWNILVAPRYSGICNFALKPIQSFESIAFAEADGIENSTGKPVHIVLFKKYYSNGNGRYLEFITPDQNSFEQEFGAYHNDEFGWDKLSGMQFRNKFAVNPSSLTGKWLASDYASLSYYYVSSGGFAGATATSIAHEFTFFNNGKYQSDHAGASGVVGNQKFSRQVYKGNYSTNNWELKLTNRFQGGAETYQCYFEAVKNGQILIMTDKHNTVYSLVKAH